MIPRSIELSMATLKKSTKYSKVVGYRRKYMDMPKENTEIFVIGRLGAWTMV